MVEDGAATRTFETVNYRLFLSREGSRSMQKIGRGKKVFSHRIPPH